VGQAAAVRYLAHGGGYALTLTDPGALGSHSVNPSRVWGRRGGTEIPFFQVFCAGRNLRPLADAALEVQD